MAKYFNFHKTVAADPVVNAIEEKRADQELQKNACCQTLLKKAMDEFLIADTFECQLLPTAPQTGSSDERPVH